MAQYIQSKMIKQSRAKKDLATTLSFSDGKTCRTSRTQEVAAQEQAWKDLASADLWAALQWRESGCVVTKPQIQIDQGRYHIRHVVLFGELKRWSRYWHRQLVRWKLQPSRFSSNLLDIGKTKGWDYPIFMLCRYVDETDANDLSREAWKKRTT